MIWFTADHHFGHENIIKYCDRPFDSVEEMDEKMIKYWNDIVSEEDEVYHLGDFTLGGFKSFGSYVNRLNGKISFIPGGHDHRWLDAHKIDPEEFKNRFDGKVSILPPLYTMKIPRKNDYPISITLCHYPLLSWERSHYGMPHLHGHSHGTFGCIEKSGDIQMPPNQNKGERMDVGVDCMAYAPISLEEVFNELGIFLLEYENGY